MKNKHYCIHAHFDLPCRENPWLEEPEPDPAAAPFHDAVERAFHTCLGPNTASPLLDEEGRVLRLVNNFTRLSFDVAPELLAWLERRARRVYGRILEADRQSRLECGGHGNALASPYPALILPLASAAEKRTALRWGIADFERRFGRAPEGMWLPETAADEETLEALIAHGIRFTLLSPTQAAKVRPAGSASETDWLESGPENLAPTRPYRWVSRRRPGRHLSVFFPRLDVSPESLFDKLPFVLPEDSGPPLPELRRRILDVGRRFANRVADSFRADEQVELSHLAVDGELFGQTRLHGNGALTTALDALDADAPARPTNYGEFLDLFPPPEEVGLRMPGSRSCIHGVGRWSADCGCRSPGQPDRPARWKGPLREALEGLGRELDVLFHERAAEHLLDADKALAAFGRAALSSDTRSTQPFLDAHSRRHLSPDQARETMRLLEAMRWRHRMLSHWAWSEADVAGPCAAHALTCAVRALDILGLLKREDPADLLDPGVPQSAPEKRFLERLAQAPSSGHLPNAAAVYSKVAYPSRIGMERAAAHFAVLDHLENGPLAAAEPPAGAAPLLERTVTPLCRRSAKRTRRVSSLSVSHVVLRRLRTFERTRACCAVVHSGEADIECWVLPEAGEKKAAQLAAALDEAFARKTPDAFREETERIFGRRHYALDSLFPSARRRAVMRLVPGGPPERRRFLEDWHSLLRRLRLDPGLASEAARALSDAAELSFAPDALPGVQMMREQVLRSAEAYARSPEPEMLDRLLALLGGAERSGLRLHLWELQDLALQGLSGRREPSESEERLARMLGLSEALFVQPPETGAAGG